MILEAQLLIAYFWPLLIVIFSALLPGAARLQHRHLAGAVLGLIGAFLIFADRQADGSDAGTLWGYLAAGGCAMIWSGYSVTNRRFSAVPSEMLIGVCGAVALAAGLAHILLEATVLPTPRQWGAIVLLGVGPVGLAFLAWDHATKRGNVPLLGTLSYLAPLISTLLLVIAGEAQPTLSLGLAALFIVGGAALATINGKKTGVSATRQGA